MYRSAGVAPLISKTMPQPTLLLMTIRRQPGAFSVPNGTRAQTPYFVAGSGVAFKNCVRFQTFPGTAPFCMRLRREIGADGSTETGRVEAPRAGIARRVADLHRSGTPGKPGP